MLATASSTSEDGRFAGFTDAERYARPVIVAWTVWAVACVGAMFMMPGRETIPYHLGWAGFALAFGFCTWSRWQLVTAMVWYTFATGVFLVRSWLSGSIHWDETAEIPLMFLLAMLMAWHVRRRQAALAHVTRLAERDVQAALDREQLMQLTSHELRTPLTIARGYVELLQTRAMELESQQDLSVVFDELERISRVSDRLIRMIRLQDDTTNEILDIDHVMAEAVERWRVVADRRWLLDARAGRDFGSPERLRTGLDTLVENAIRYTTVGDTIRLVGSRSLDHITVGVFDSGVGLSDQQILAMNAGDQSHKPEMTGRDTATDTDNDGDAARDMDTRDGLSGTGLGLSIVRALANARGGMLHASHAPDGGAAMILTFPLDTLGAAGPFVPRAASDAMPLQHEPPTGRNVAARVVAPGGAKN